MPSEHALCEQFQVSRDTLRRSLALLSREKLIRAKNGVGWLLVRSSARRHFPPKITGVNWINFFSLEHLSRESIFLLFEMHRRLASRGIDVSLYTGPQFERPSSLAGVAAAGTKKLWVLFGYRRKAVEYLEKHRIPFLVVSNRKTHPPSVGFDLEVMFRHLAGLVSRLGHRRVVLLLPHRLATPLGHKYVEGRQELSGFKQAFENTIRQMGGQIGLTGKAVFHPATPLGLRNVVSQLTRGQAPTVWVVLGPHYVLGTINSLKSRGLRVPQDISVIGIGYESFYAFAAPSIAFYSENWTLYAKTLWRLLEKYLATADNTLRATIPFDFHPGESLGCARPPA